MQMSLSCGVPVLPGNLVRNTLRSRASAGRPALVRVAHGGAGGIIVYQTVGVGRG